MNSEDITVLSRKDEETYFEIANERDSAKRVFEAAMTRYHNTLTDIRNSERKWWHEHLAEAYSLDLKVTDYIAEYDPVIRRVVIKVKDE